MRLRRVAIAGLVGIGSIGIALACGPNFPWQLLNDRQQTMTAPVDLGFTSEITRLMPALPDGLHAVEDHREQLAQYSAAIERDEAQSAAWQGLTTLTPQTAVEKLRAARDASDGKDALAAGDGLPVAVVEYIAGAVEFRESRFDTALAHFEAIDRLPPEQRRVRAVAAAYMQGRIHQQAGQFSEARAAFGAARIAAQAGAPDPMGLGVASLGEEARLDLIEAGRADTNWPVGPALTDDTEIDARIGRAIELYAEQIARGSRVGLSSLRMTLPKLLADPGLRPRLVANPKVRRIIVAYALSRNELWPSYGSDDHDARLVVDVILAQPTVEKGDDLDRLAALAYMTGRYEAAERLAASPNGPVGLWVRAKLAIRRDDRAAAVRDLTAALTSAEAGDILDRDGRLRLRGETAVGRLAEGDYAGSLQTLFPVSRIYWGDVVYIAERVLTVDELKAFVDGLSQAPQMPLASPVYEYAFPKFPIERLRGVLARRLVRDGRIAEAFPYFPARQPVSDPPQQTAGDVARAYLAALEAANAASRWQNVSRAESLFTAATLARQSGMEIMGTEGPPDMTAIGGVFPSGYGLTQPDREHHLLGPDEASRFAASAPHPDLRFHYREVAMNHALAAADLLPQRSQAYAATLCWATRFAIESRDLAQADAIYRRYLRTGAYQAWAASFGQECPQPNFTAARDYWLHWTMRWTRSHKTDVLGSALAVALLLAGSLFAIRRRRA
jgi:tetratricopeptide (TPR) repeat protein